MSNPVTSAPAGERPAPTPLAIVAPDAAERPAIEAEALTKRFARGAISVTAVDEISLVVPRGRMIALRGPSGCGKSTLLNLLGALDRPTSGRLVVDGVDLTTLSGRGEAAFRRYKTGFVFQSFNLIPHFTALENVMLPMEFTPRPRTEAEERASTLLLRVGIELNRQDHRPSRLSGGQQQRVAIARAIANDPAIVLADEPTANLDSKTGRRIVDLLKDLAREGRTVVVATHDAEIAARADLIIEMVDGRIAGIRELRPIRRPT